MDADGRTGTVGSDREVAPGVYRFGSERVNWYVIDGEEGVTVVDAGLPDHWEQLQEGLEGLGRNPDDVEALVLTHGDVDHIGFAERLRERGVPVFVHEADADMVREPSGAPPLGMLLNLWRPAMAGLLLEFVRSGAGSIEGVGSVQLYGDGDTLDVPGGPGVIHVPGHTQGECVLHLSDRGVLFAGDAILTADLLTGRPGGPQMAPGIFTADMAQARESLSRLESLGEVVLLPGHGNPWMGDASEAVRLAREG